MFIPWSSAHKCNIFHPLITGAQIITASLSLNTQPSSDPYNATGSLRFQVLKVSRFHLTKLRSKAFSVTRKRPFSCDESLKKHTQRQNSQLVNNSCLCSRYSFIRTGILAFNKEERTSLTSFLGHKDAFTETLKA